MVLAGLVLDLVVPLYRLLVLHLKDGLFQRHGGLQLVLLLGVVLLRLVLLVYLNVVVLLVLIFGPVVVVVFLEVLLLNAGHVRTLGKILKVHVLKVLLV